MIVLECNQPTYWDVDRTLLHWEETYGDDCVKVKCDSYEQYLKPHNRHVEQLIAHKKRGHTTIVWSAGGSKWALAAVKALGIEEYVDLVLEKPMWCYDDKQPSEFMPKADYLEDK